MEAAVKSGSGREITRWQSELMRYVHRLTGDPDLSEDLAQEALLRLLRVRSSNPPDNPRAWLYRVTTNLVRDHARRNEMMRGRAIPADADEPATPEQQLERRETVAQVRAVLGRLSPRDREILILSESGFRHREIAGIVDVKPQSVSVLVARALERFRMEYMAEAAR